MKWKACYIPERAETLHRYTSTKQETGLQKQNRRVSERICRKKYNKKWKNDSISLYLAWLECWMTYNIIVVYFNGETMLLKTFEVVSSPNGNTIQCDRTIRIGLALPLTFLLTNYLPVSFVVKSDLLRSTDTRMPARCLTSLPQRCQNS